VVTCFVRGPLPTTHKFSETLAFVICASMGAWHATVAKGLN